MTRAERLREIRDSIAAQVQLKRLYVSLGAKPDYYRQDVARMRENAAKILADADRREQQINNWRTLADTAADRIDQLQQEIVEIEQADKIARLERLVSEAEGLAAE